MFEEFSFCALSLPINSLSQLIKASNPVFQEDVFAQQYYRSEATGNKRVYNQIDLENKGGLVWIKQVGNKSCGGNNRMVWMDSLMGVGKYMNFSSAEIYPSTDATSLVSFNTDGFTVGASSQWNDALLDRSSMQRPYEVSIVTYQISDGRTNIY